MVSSVQIAQIPLFDPPILDERQAPQGGDGPVERRVGSLEEKSEEGENGKGEKPAGVGFEEGKVQGDLLTVLQRYPKPKGDFNPEKR